MSVSKAFQEKKNPCPQVQQSPCVDRMLVHTFPMELSVLCHTFTIVVFKPFKIKPCVKFICYHYGLLRMNTYKSTIFILFTVSACPCVCNDYKSKLWDWKLSLPRKSGCNKLNYIMPSVSMIFCFYLTLLQAHKAWVVII